MYPGCLSYGQSPISNCFVGMVNIRYFHSYSFLVIHYIHQTWNHKSISLNDRRTYKTSTLTVENLKKVKSIEEVANSLLHKVYRWEPYYLSDMTGSLVKQSVATAKRPIDQNRPICVFTRHFWLCIRKRVFFEKLVPKQNN